MATKNLKDIVERIISVTHDTGSRDAYDVIIRLFLEALEYELSIGNDVKLRGVGTIKWVNRVGTFNINAYNLKNIGDKATNLNGTQYKNDRVLRFVASEKFYAALN